MTKFCPICGTPNEDSAHYCIKCGYNFEAQNVQQETSTQESNTQSETQTQNLQFEGGLWEKLDTLRSAFFWLFIGMILSIIPLADIVGVIILLVGFILLIIGFGNVSRTALPHANEYASTRKWLIIALLYAIVMIILIIMIFISIISSTNSGLDNALFAIISIMDIVYIIIYLIAYLKIVNSLKFLSKDLQVQRLYDAGNYLFYSLIVSIVMLILTPIILFAYGSVFTISSSSGITMAQIYSILAPFMIIFVIAIIGFVFQLIGYHSAYTGIDQFRSRYGFFSPSPKPPQMPGTPPIQ